LRRGFPKLLHGGLRVHQVRDGEHAQKAGYGFSMCRGH
jgi:hypothetical protein